MRDLRTTAMLEGAYALPSVTEPDDVIYGGTFGSSTLDRQTTLWDVWHKRTAITLKADRVNVVRCVFDNYGDAVAVSANGARRVRSFGILSCYARDGHDDFCENDVMADGSIIDTCVDGGFVFCSTRYGSDNLPPDGTDATMVISRCLVRLAAFEQSYKPAKYGTWHHGPFFKVPTNPSEGIAPRFSISSSVFAAEADTPYGDLGPPPRCSADDVTLIWLGPAGTSWPGAALRAWEGCTRRLTVLAGMDEWNRRCDAWKRAHALP